MNRRLKNFLIKNAKIAKGLTVEDFDNFYDALPCDAKIVAMYELPTMYTVLRVECPEFKEVKECDLIPEEEFDFDCKEVEEDEYSNHPWKDLMNHMPNRNFSHKDKRPGFVSYKPIGDKSHRLGQDHFYNEYLCTLNNESFVKLLDDLLKVECFQFLGKNKIYIASTPPTQEDKECPECFGAGFIGKLYPNGHTEVKCETCFGVGYFDTYIEKKQITCSHKPKLYQGFTDSFNYCETCGEKL